MKCARCNTKDCLSWTRLFDGSADPIDAEIEADKACSIRKIAEELADIAQSLREMQAR